MPREKKYGEETKMISIRVPVSKFKAVGELVREFLSNIKPEEISVTDVKPPKLPKPKSKKETEIKTFSCGCSIEGGLLRKPKGTPCKKTKEEHLSVN